MTAEPLKFLYMRDMKNERETESDHQNYSLRSTNNYWFVCYLFNLGTVRLAMRWLAAIILAALIFLAYTVKAHALVEVIDNVSVPIEVSLNVQAEYQGYIIYAIRQEGGTYVATLSRDGTPHQYPLRTVVFSLDWELLSDRGLRSPKPPEPKPEPEPEAKPEPALEPPVKPQAPEPVPAPEKPEKPEKPEPPVVKPPEEEESTEPEEPEEE